MRQASFCSAKFVRQLLYYTNGRFCVPGQNAGESRGLFEWSQILQIYVIVDMLNKLSK